MHELIERFDGHLKAEQFYSVIANMRGSSPEAVAKVLLDAPGLQGLQVIRVAGTPACMHACVRSACCCTAPIHSTLQAGTMNTRGARLLEYRM